MTHSDDNKCFSEIEIGAYMDGRLSDSEREAFEARLIKCRPCWDEFVAISGVAVSADDAAAGDVPEHVIGKVINMYPGSRGVFDIVIGLVTDMAELVFSADGFDTMPAAYAAQLRGDKIVRPEMIVLKKSFDDIDVELDIEKVAGEQCNIRVAVDDLKAKLLMNTLRVELISRGRELVSNLVEDGETVLEDIGAGQYIIKIHKQGKVFGEICLKIQ